MSSNDENMMKSEIISISLSKALLDKIDAVQAERKFQSRSEVIRHALQSYTLDLERTYGDDQIDVFIVAISYFTSRMKSVDIQEIIKDFTSNLLMVSRVQASSTVTIITYILKSNLSIARIFFEKLSGVKGLIDKKLFSLRTAV